MTPYGIVYRDTVAALNEGAGIWQKKSGIINKKYLIMTAVIISLIIIVANRIILTFYSEPQLYQLSNILFTVVEIISVIFILTMTIKRNAKNSFITASSSKIIKQAVLRDNDIEFKTAYSKANYFYDEIESVVEGIYSLNIILEKGNLPICISKIDIAKGDIERFIFILRNKMNERYFVEKNPGGRRI